MKSHKCPYMRRDKTCSNINMRLADCIYVNRPEKCPILRDSKAWLGVRRFFKKKSTHDSPNPLKPLSDKEVVE